MDRARGRSFYEPYLIEVWNNIEAGFFQEILGKLLLNGRFYCFISLIFHAAIIGYILFIIDRFYIHLIIV